MSSNGKSASNTPSKKGKQKQGACTECHKSKNKCVYPNSDLTDPTIRPICVRCRRNGKQCIPHKSRQGKRKHRSLEEMKRYKDGHANDGFLNAVSRDSEDKRAGGRAQGIIGFVVGDMTRSMNGVSDQSNREERLRLQSMQNLQNSSINLRLANGIIAVQNRISNMQRSPAAASSLPSDSVLGANSQSLATSAETNSMKLALGKFMSTLSDNPTNSNSSGVASQASGPIRNTEHDKQSSVRNGNSIAGNKQSSGGSLQHVKTNAIGPMDVVESPDDNNQARRLINAALKGSGNDNKSATNESVPTRPNEMSSEVLRHGLLQNPEGSIVAASIDGVSNSGTTVHATNVLKNQQPNDGFSRSNSQSSHHTRASLPSRMSELSDATGATGMDETSFRSLQRMLALQSIQPLQSLQSGSLGAGHDVQMTNDALLLLANTLNPGGANSVSQLDLEGITGAGCRLERNAGGGVRDASSEPAAIPGSVLRPGISDNVTQSPGQDMGAPSDRGNIATGTGGEEIGDSELAPDNVEIIQGISPPDNEEVSTDNDLSSIPPPLQNDGPTQECTEVNDIHEPSAVRRSSSKLSLTPENEIGMHFARACAKHSGKQLTSLKHHYGMQCLIREWISMALARRSFALLGKASVMADRCGIYMDRILCGVAEDESGEEDENTSSQKLSGGDNNKNIGGRMHYLLSLLLEPHSSISRPLDGRQMLIPRLSPAFLSLVGCQSCPTFQPQDIRNRWIFIRETSCGISRFYCSPAFERNILCWKVVSEIFENNLADIFSLIFSKTDFRRILACIAHQLSLHSTEGMSPRPVHAPNTTVRLLGKNWGQLQMDRGDSIGITNMAKELVEQSKTNSVMTFEMDSLLVMLPEMDKTTYYLEFFHQSAGSGNGECGGEVEGDHCRRDEITNGNPPTTHWRKTMASRESSQEENEGFASASNIHRASDAQSANGSTTSNKGRSTPMSSSSQPPKFDECVDPELWVGIDDVLASGDIDDLITALMD